MCVESMEEPQQAAPGMIFSARARLGIPHTETGVNKDSQEPRVREQKRGNQEEILTEVAVLSSQCRKFCL